MSDCGAVIRQKHFTEFNEISAPSRKNSIMSDFDRHFKTADGSVGQRII